MDHILIVLKKRLLILIINLSDKQRLKTLKWNLHKIKDLTAGHRGMGTKAMFRNIDQLVEGDVFYIYTMYDDKLMYKITGQKVIYPHDTRSLNIQQNKDLVTLLTCHPYRHNYQRLLVQGERKESSHSSK